MAAKNYTKKISDYGFVSADPLPTDQDLVDHYSSKYYNAPSTSTYQTGYTEDEIRQKKLRAELAIHSLEKSCGGKIAGKILFEVGYGEGFVLDAAKKAGMEIAGVDFTNAGLLRMNEHLAPLVAVENAYSHLDSLIEKGEKFDFCVIQNVLEHVIDPYKMLMSLKKILKDDGVLLINVPNDYSRLQKLAIDKKLIDREFWFGPVEHLHYFNTENLPSYVQSLGFDVLDTYGDFPIDIFLLNEHSNYVMDKSKGKASHNARIMMDLLMAENGIEPYHKFCQAMSGVGIGRNVCVVARPAPEKS